MNEIDQMKMFLRWRKSYTRPHMTVLEKPHMNAVYIKKGETWDHAIKKFEVAFKCVQSGHKIVTEAQRVSDGEIPDVSCFECGETEVVNTHGDIEYYKKKGRNVVSINP